MNSAFDSGSVPLQPSGGVAPMPMQSPMSQEQPMGGGGMPQKNYVSQEDLIEEREQAYEEAFKDTAYNVFSAKHADLVPYLVTFKVIRSSIEEGDAVGAFIVNMNNETFYVPIVMADNKMKPMEVLYSKTADKFLPFTKEWLKIIAANSAQPLGQPVQAPDSLKADVDISNFVRPPLDGRVAYAEAMGDLDHLEIISQAGDAAKAQYRDMLKGNKAMLKFAAENFDPEHIYYALQSLEKEAAEEKAPLQVQVVDQTTGAAKVKEIFGSKAKDAMRYIANEGFAYRDERVNLNRAMGTDVQLRLEEPTDSGVYQVYNSSGEAETVLILVNPRGRDYHDGPQLMGGLNEEDQMMKKTTLMGPNTRHKHHRHYTVIKENGDFFHTHKLTATRAATSDMKGLVAKILFGNKSASAVTKSNICFIKVEGHKVVDSHEPVYVDVTETTKDGHKKYVKFDPFHGGGESTPTGVYGKTKHKKNDVEKEIVHADTPTGKPVHPTNSRLCIMPKSYKVVKLGDELNDRTVLQTPGQILQFVQQRLSDHGGTKVKVAHIDSDMYTINGRESGTLKEAAFSLATDYRVSMDTAVRFMRDISYGANDTMLVVGAEKSASIFNSPTPGSQMSPETVQQDAMSQMGAQGGGQQGGQPMDPQGMQMAQMGMQSKDPELYSLGVLNGLANNPDIKELLAVHSPTLEKAMDSLGRMLLTFWLRGSKAKTQLGEETYSTTEEALRTVFKGLGSLLIKVNRQAASMTDEQGM